MKYQKPAQGILQINDWGNSVMYKAVCDCGQDDCSHTIDIEAEETGINVTIYTTQKTIWWSESSNPFNGFIKKIKLTWELWTKGYIEYQSTIVLNKHAALNYAETIKTALNDIETKLK